MRNIAGGAFGAFTAFALSLWMATPAHAGGPGTVYSPRVEQGEWELEYKGRYYLDRDSERREEQSKFAVGYGITSYWWTEGYAEYQRTTESGGGWSAFEWENRFQLTEPGQYWLDLGAIVELERTHPGKGKETTAGLLAEKDIGETTLTVNWLAVRTFGGEEATPRWEQVYRTQWAWRWRPELEPLVQWQGDEHSGYAGPGFSGKAKIGTQRIAYHLAWLSRTNGDVPRNALRVELEFEL